ncbi:iron(III) transport system ATP-binding protein [Advenella incenata]|jgi:iron(III) transport system ATP-binding protein|uniref:Iron(III) transport system ATP-binding protein n=1 Tax=Advenella incenata TaxID=267800 RepID=A0A4Q7VUI4_9BURK|nr:ABC transporter ATP-binding protein [Advenella incenata]RZU00223.1 iron(III) transport system ATP-binding protein [Advenella incenata]
MHATPILQINDIRLGYKQDRRMKVVVDGYTMQVPAGEIVCLLGPSGCGKTTVLRAIAGFEPVYAGQILLDGQVIAEPDRMVEPEHRRIGMMFQDYALFPHLTIEQNVAFGLRKQTQQARRQRVDELLELVRLADLRDRYPHELSGGQQQRIALVRSLAPSPKLLLLDEAFSNLDTEIRRQLVVEVRSILKHSGISAILVTHNLEEAEAIADHIGTMKDGKLQAWRRMDKTPTQ